MSFCQVCTKLRAIAAALKIKAEKVEEAVREVVGEGVTKATEIYVKVVEFMKREVLSKTCVDFLAPRVSSSYNFHQTVWVAENL